MSQPQFEKCYKFKVENSHQSLNAFHFHDDSKGLYGVVSGRCNVRESTLVIENFLLWFPENYKTRTIENAFEKTFKQLNVKFCERNPTSGGLSLIAAFFHAPYLHIAWVGDNKAYGIFKVYDSEGNLTPSWFDLIKYKHTTNNKKEYERILNCKEQLPNFFISTEEVGKPPLIDGHYSYTRSIGDATSDSFCISKPDYICYQLCYHRAKKILLLSNIVQCDWKELRDLMNSKKSSKNFITALKNKYTIEDPSMKNTKKWQDPESKNNLLPFAGILIKVSHKKCLHQF